MNTYQRLIGYFYSYDNNVRNNCAGFAKLEMRENSCRIMIKANICNRNGFCALIYGIYPYGDKLGLRILDRTIITRSTIELRLESVQAEQACNLLGILIRLSETCYCAATWSGSSVAGEDLILIPEGDALPPVCELTSPEKEALSPACDLTVPEKEALSPACDLTVPEKEALPPVCELTVPEKEALPPACDLTVPEKEVLPPACDLTVPEKEALPPVCDLTSPEEEDCIEACADSREDDIYECPPDTPVPEICDDEPVTPPVADVPDTADNACYDVRSPERIRIFRICPRYYPFDDYEFSDCARLEPRDLGLLPPDMWGYINNSFLMHAYYCYGHLLLGRKGVSDGSEYYLMLPGINCRREAAMAKKYGFPEFKSAKKTAPLPGAFGYWTVNLGKC